MIKKLGPSSAVTDSGIHISFDKDVIKYIDGNKSLILDRSPIDQKSKEFYVEIEGLDQYLSAFDKSSMLKEKETIKNNIIKFADLFGYRCIFI